MDNAGQLASRPYDPQQAVQYGQFIELAYTMYAGAPTNPTPPPPSSFIAGYKFVAWVQMKDFVIEDGNWTFYGLIAQRTSKSNEFVLAIRGTENLAEWWDDFTSAVLVPLTGFGQVAYGFNRIYQTLRVVDYTLTATARAEAAPTLPAATFAQQVAATVQRHASLGHEQNQATAQAVSPSTSMEVTGHSLGAALATLYAAENAGDSHVTTPVLCTFASPRVGDSTFATKFDQLAITSWRIVNELDVVPKLPFLGFTHIATEHAYNSGSSVNWSVGCWHSLATYLNLLDPKQPISQECRVSQKVAAIAAAPLLASAKMAAMIPAVPTPAPKEIALATPSGEGTTINITIKIGGSE